MQGLPTIRAFGAGERFKQAFVGELDANGAWWFAFIATARWIGFRLDFISAVMLTVASILAMAIHNKAILLPLPFFLSSLCLLSAQ
jgi:hypothetical protein